MTNFYKMGRTHAELALDTYPLNNDNIDSAFENLCDTLAEMGIREWGNEHIAAYNGFEDVLISHNRKHRPHGLVGHR